MSTPGLGLGEAQPAADPQAAYRMQVAVARAGIKRGASWFDWIAAFSIIIGGLERSDKNSGADDRT